MNNRYVGYARVSTKEQNEDRQIMALVEYGVSPNRIFTDKISGKDFERQNYQQMLKTLKSGDILVIKSIDRLGRNYNEILEQWRIITKVKNVDIVVLDMDILDTTQHKDLLGTFISDMVLQLLSYVAENERMCIHQRQAEGIAAAKARGVRFGRPVKFSPENYLETFIKYRKMELSKNQAIEIIGCKEHTFYRMLGKLRKDGKLD